ncbi:MAG TPA: MlaD family protein, partial [Acidimicrobiales bacterium]|nr:MlaD family protein [Acidimicrobiales bacterium]
MNRPLRLLVVVLAAAVVVSGVTVLVKASDGAFSGQYALSGLFSASGEGLHAGSVVSDRGVQVGRVTGITLSGGRADVTLAIDPGFRVPSDATATIRPLNVFGADQVELTIPAGDHSPPLAPGSRITHTAVAPELTDLFAAADPLLAQIDAPDLSTIVSNLAQ